MEIKELRMICEQKLNKSIKEGNKKQIQSYSVINDILKNDNCFKILDVNIVFNILKDLGFDIDQSLKIYSEILK